MASQTTGLSSRDVLRFQMCDDPQVSPDGRAVAWVRTSIDAEHDAYRSHICITEIADGETRELYAGQGRDTYPRWSPDGQRIAFLSAPAGTRQTTQPPAAVAALDTSPQLLVVAASGGEPRALTALRGGARNPVWSPDGSRIAFTTLVDPRHGLEPLGGANAGDDLYARFNRDVLSTDRLHWKSDAAGLLGNYYAQLAVVGADDGDALPEPLLLTRDAGDWSAPVWSPDSRYLASTGNRAPEGESLRKKYIYLVDTAAAAPAEPRELWGLQEMRSSDLAWSPDGTTLAVCGHDDPVIGHYGLPRLWLVSLHDGSASCVTRDYEVALGDHSRNYDLRRYGGDDGPRWLPDGSGLLVLSNQAGTVHLQRFTIAGAHMAPLTGGDYVVSAFSTDRSGEVVVALIGNSVEPGDLYLVRADGVVRRLTDINHELLGDVELSSAQRFHCDSGGVQIEGWVNPPVGCEAGRRYPVILYTGGGPGGMRASVFVHEWQVYAAAGYVVINCNTRGNYGYGEPFSVATRGTWGDLDYQDNMAFLRAACEAFPFIDGERMAVAGGSYGGYSAAWIIGRHPEFKAAVVDRALVNRTSQVGTSDIGYLLDQVEFDKRAPWDNVDTLIERSPIRSVGAIRTPTLVVHSAQDQRCAVEQGEQFYLALKRAGVPTELVRFPNESHELSRSGRPWHRVFRIDRYLEWFGRWL